jgi:hypothetical protein
VIERFPARPRRFYGNLQVFFNAILPDVIGKIRRADAGLDPSVLIQRLPGNYPIPPVRHFLRHLSHPIVVIPTSAQAVEGFAFLLRYSSNTPTRRSLSVSESLERSNSAYSFAKRFRISR